MFGGNTSQQFDSEESITQYMTSTFLDAEYKIEHNWKMCYMHPYQYLEHPAYQEKRKELQKNNKSIKEHLGFLLFPPLYGCNSYVPVLNQEFMEVLATYKHCPPQTLGNSSDGVSLFKSVDVLLKFASCRRCKSPKIAVYKFLEGSPNTSFCDIYEEFEIGSPDPNYDSFSLIPLDGELDETDLSVQLRFSEVHKFIHNKQYIFLYDTKSKGTYSVTRSCPRQTTPVTLISFLPLRPFIVPRPIVRRIKVKKKVLKKNDAHSDKDSIASSDRSYQGGVRHRTPINFINSSESQQLYKDLDQNTSTAAADSQLHNEQISTSFAASPNTDLVNEAALTAGLININVETPIPESPNTEDTENLLMNLNNHSINSLCCDAGINIRDATSNRPLPAVECTKSHEIMSDSSLVVQNSNSAKASYNSTTRKAVNEIDQMFNVNIESMSATIRLNAGIRGRLDEFLTSPCQIPRIITSKEGLIMANPVDHTNEIVSQPSAPLEIMVTQNEDNIFDMLSDMLVETGDPVKEQSTEVIKDLNLVDPPAVQRAVRVESSDAQRPTLATPTRLQDSDADFNMEENNSETTYHCQNADIDILSPPLTEESPNAWSQKDLPKQNNMTPTINAQSNGDSVCVDSPCVETVVAEQMSYTPDNGHPDSTDSSILIVPDTPQALQAPTHGIIAAPCTASTPTSGTPGGRKRGRPRKTVVLPGEPLPSRPKRKLVESRKRKRRVDKMTQEFDYESSTILPLVVEARRLENVDFRVGSSSFNSVEVLRCSPLAIVKNLHEDLVEIQPRTDLPVINPIRKSSLKSRRWIRNRPMFCQTIDDKLASLAVANIVCCGNLVTDCENTGAVTTSGGSEDVTSVEAENRAYTPESTTDNNTTAAQPQHDDNQGCDQVTEDSDVQPQFAATIDDLMEPAGCQNASFLETNFLICQQNTCDLEALSDAIRCHGNGCVEIVNVENEEETENRAGPETPISATRTSSEVPADLDLELASQVVVEEEVSDTSVEVCDDLDDLVIVEHETTGASGFHTTVTDVANEALSPDTSVVLEANSQMQECKLTVENNAKNVKYFEQSDDRGKHVGEDCSVVDIEADGFAMGESLVERETTCETKSTSPGSSAVCKVHECSSRSDNVPDDAIEIVVDSQNGDLNLTAGTGVNATDGNVRSSGGANVSAMSDLFESVTPPDKETIVELNTTGRSVFSTPSSNNECTVAMLTERSPTVISQSFAEGVTKLDETMSPQPGNVKTPTSSVRKRRKLFYGRPLLVAKSAPPFQIPIDCTTEVPCRDPRYSITRAIKKERTFLPCMWKADQSVESASLKPATDHQQLDEEGVNSSAAPNSGNHLKPTQKLSSVEFNEPRDGYLTGDGLDLNNNTTSKPDTEPNLVPKQVSAFGKPLSSEEVVNEASNYRVNLLLSRKVLRDTETEFSDQDSFYEQAQDEIVFGTSPRDFFPQFSSTEDSDSFKSPPKKRSKPSELKKSAAGSKKRHTHDVNASDIANTFCPPTDAEITTSGSQGLRGILTPVSSQNRMKNTATEKAQEELRRKLESKLTDCMRKLDC